MCVLCKALRSALITLFWMLCLINHANIQFYVSLCTVLFRKDVVLSFSLTVWSFYPGPTFCCYTYKDLNPKFFKFYFFCNTGLIYVHKHTQSTCSVQTFCLSYGIIYSFTQLWGFVSFSLLIEIIFAHLIKTFGVVNSVVLVWCHLAEIGGASLALMLSYSALEMQTTSGFTM